MSLTKSQRLLTASLATAGVGALAAVAFSGSASAQTPAAKVSVSGAGIAYQAAAGQTNNLTITKSSERVENDTSPFGSARYTYRLDDSVPITSDSDECAYPNSGDRTLIVCTFVYESGQDPDYMSSFKLGDQNDKVKFFNPTNSYDNDRIHLGAGNDTYTSADLGKEDDSRIEGGAGNDTVTTGKQLGDVAGIAGGSGNDTIRTSGQGWVQGQAGNDKIYAGAGAQSLDGGTGNDLIHGGSGNDSIVGGAGNDTLYGEAGADQIWGNSGNDKLYGGKGTDTLSGGPGRDVIKQ